MNFDKIISIVGDLNGSKCEPKEELSKYSTFPYRTALRGQNEAIQSIIEEDVSLLCSHTGSGKSACFLAAAHESNQPTIVIEPRKFLQKQIGEYFGDFVLYGKSNYPCSFAPSAASGPCLKTHEKKGKKYFNVKNQLSGKIDEKPYPCDGCEYLEAKAIAKNVLLENRGVLILNFGNFWQYVRLAQFIVIDEADEFFRAISSGVELEYVFGTDFDYERDLGLEPSPKELIEIEINAIDNAIEEIKTKQTIEAEDARDLQQFQRRLQKLDFFQRNINECFLYQKKERVYVELQPNKTSVLLDRMFPGKKVCIVTATPSNFNGAAMKTIEYSVPMRAKILYAPIGLMTSRNVYTMHHEYLLEDAGWFITNIFEVFRAMFGSQKVVIHCGNLGGHAKLINAVLEANRFKTILHEQGKLKETIETFLDDDATFLLVVSAEYGLDFKDIDLQFVLKVPYAAKDERLKALEKGIGKKAFNEYYTMDALNRLVQQCGRVGRGANSFGVTFILDSKFKSLCEKFNAKLPGWFKERVVMV